MNLAGSCVLVAAGGALGAVSRYLVTVAVVASGWRFPLQTLIVNVTGCLLAGLIVGYLYARGSGSTGWQLFLVTGVLGAFTTFSAFSVEALRLTQAGQSGQALAHVLLNVIGALLAVLAGWSLSRLIQ